MDLAYSCASKVVVGGGHCGFIGDNVQTARPSWKDATLCNSGKLSGDVLQAALGYRIALVKRVGIELGTAMLGAMGVLALAAAGMWVAKGGVIERADEFSVSINTKRLQTQISRGRKV